MRADEAEKLAKKYVANLNFAFSTLEEKSGQEIWSVRNEDLSYVLDLAMRYHEDAKRFLQEKRFLTSIAASSYAEGLLDALRFLGLISLRWPDER